MTGEQPEDEARSYLLRLLRGRDVDLKAASLLAGKNHAYLQQYIRKRKPAWLPEDVREALVRHYGADPERLKPPALRTGQVTDSGGQDGEVQPPGEHQLIDQPRLIELIRIWSQLSEERRNLALSILRNLIQG